MESVTHVFTSVYLFVPQYKFARCHPSFKFAEDEASLIRNVREQRQVNLSIFNCLCLLELSFDNIFYNMEFQ